MPPPGPDRPRRTSRAAGARDPRRAENVDARRRQNLALRLFLGGQTSYEAIAATPDPERPGQPLYADRGSAHKAVTRAISRLTADRDTTAAIDVALAQLDALHRTLWPVALNPNAPDRWEAFNQLRWIFQERQKITGTYAPLRSKVKVITSDDVDAAIRQLTEEIARGDALDAALLAADHSGADPTSELVPDDLSALDPEG